METKIGIIKEPSIDLDLDGMLECLNFLCEGFSFSKVEIEDYLMKGYVTHPDSFRELQNLINIDPKINWIIYFTESCFENNFFYDEFRGLIIVSFYNWNLWTNLPKSNGLVYFICSLMGDALDEDESARHSINTGCIFDFLSDKRGIDRGMKMASICPDCYNRIASYNKTSEDILLLKNLEVLMRELASASTWNQNILELWKSKSWSRKRKVEAENQQKEVETVDFHELIEMIKVSEFEKVFSILEKRTTNNHQLYNSIVLLSVNWNELRNKERLNVINEETAQMIRNRIVLAILDTVNEIKMN